MTTPRHQPLRNLLPWLLIVLGLLGSNSALFGQAKQPPSPQAYSTKMHVQRSYYDPPNQDQVKMEVSGQGMTNLASGALITGAKINSYAATGGPPQLTAETSSCIFDISTSQINSTNLLQVRSGDGNLYLEGVGFLWQKTAPDLTLSNRVHTILHQPPSTNKPNASPSQTDIYSDHATFDMKSGTAIYHDHIRVIDPRLNLTCVALTVQLTQGETNRQLDHILAETNVIMDFIDDNGRKTHATSDKAVYTRMTIPVTNDLLELSGHPRLETTNGWATADIFVMNQTTGKIQGAGNCHFHNATIADSTAAKTNDTPATEITSDNFDYDTKTGLAIFHDNVRVDNQQMKLACDTLTAKLQGEAAQTNGPRNIVAEDNVAIDYFDEHGDKTHATSQKAVYSSSVVNGLTNKVLELTGNPMLERTNAWIKADLITMDQAKGIIRGEGNHHTVFKNQSGQGGKTASSKAADTEIFSDHFDFNRNTGIAFYRGNARVVDPQMHLQSRQIMIKLPAGSDPNRTGRPDRMVAETNVIVDYLTEKGEKTHATGEKMVFTHAVTNQTTTNEVLELTGNPNINMTNLKGDKTHATGDKVVYTSTVAGGTTNGLVTLSGRPLVESAEGVITADETIIYDPNTGKAHGVGARNHIIFAIPDKNAKTNLPPAALNAPPH